MSDMRICSVCKEEFDFDEKGLGCGKIVVCGDVCAKISAEGRGHRYTIHDKTGDIVETNADGTEQIHHY
ncbi:MAG: hypothetical protein ACTSSP_11495 [Candidatus Asgardarchaeia archaeon]